MCGWAASVWTRRLTSGAWCAPRPARVYRPVTFAERGRAVAEAVAEDDPVTAVLQGLSRRSILNPAGEEPELLAALAVALAGGSDETLSFDEAARQACERHGWSWDRVLETPAWLVDRAASELSADAPDDGWSTFIFESSEIADVPALARQMAKNLLRRSIDCAPDRAAAESSRRSKAADAQARVRARRMRDESAVTSAANAIPAMASAGSEANSLPASAGPPPGEPASPVVGVSHQLDRSTSESPDEPAAAPPSVRSPVTSDETTRGSAGTNAREEPIAFAETSATAGPLTAVAAPAFAPKIQPPDGVWTGLPEIATLAALPPAAGAWPRMRKSRLPAGPADARARQDGGVTTAWLDDVADALAAECDLRGLDR